MSHPLQRKLDRLLKLEAVIPRQRCMALFYPFPHESNEEIAERFYALHPASRGADNLFYFIRYRNMDAIRKERGRDPEYYPPETVR